MLLAPIALFACGGEPGVALDASEQVGDDAAGRDGAQAFDAPPAPGWDAPFALDPEALGLTTSVTWDFTLTKQSGADPVLVTGLFENASNTTAPVSGPGVGRALFSGDPNDGAAWVIAAATGMQKRRVYFRDMFALSSPYAASTNRESYVSMPQMVQGMGSVGQSTIDFTKAQTPTTEAEALSVPLRLSVGVKTPNGPSYPQTSGPELTRGAWHQLEAYFVANSPNVADGIARVWLDGVLVIEKTDVVWASGDAYWQDIVFSDRRQTSALPLPAGGQHRDHDHLQVFWSTTRE